MTRELGSTGMSADVADSVVSDPKRTKAIDPDVLVTTTLSPPPANVELTEIAPAESAVVPFDRNGLIEPVGIGKALRVTQCAQPRPHACRSRSLRSELW